VSRERSRDELASPKTCQQPRTPCAVESVDLEGGSSRQGARSSRRSRRSPPTPRGSAHTSIAASDHRTSAGSAATRSASATATSLRPRTSRNRERSPKVAAAYTKGNPAAAIATGQGFIWSPSNSCNAMSNERRSTARVPSVAHARSASTVAHRPREPHATRRPSSPKSARRAHSPAPHQR